MVKVFQQDLRKYRVAFFEALSERVGDDRFVLFLPQGAAVNGYRKRVGFFAWKIFGRFRLFGPRKCLATSDCIVLPFDLGWLVIYSLLFSSRYPKVILWGHGFGRTTNSGIARAIRIRLAKKAKGLIFYDEASRKTFIEAGNITPAKCFVAPNTLKVGNHGVSERALMGKEFLFVGRLIPGKKVDKLIEAMAMLVATEEEVRLNIVGDGVERTRLQELVEARGLNHAVLFHGSIHDESQLKPIFHQSRAYVCTGPAGLGIVHSMAYGTPVMIYQATHHGPEFEYCSASNSIFYSEDDVENLAAKMEEFLNDPQAYRELSKNSYATFQDQGSLKVMVDGFFKAIQYACPDGDY